MECKYNQAIILSILSHDVHIMHSFDKNYNFMLRPAILKQGKKNLMSSTLSLKMNDPDSFKIIRNSL
ncbi:MULTISPECIES: hypothetical protein [unclassified Sphingobacterium]|nr:MULTISPECIES: hypothetical protein [unclassified Sphingobacterium]